ncbi:HAMP domain-containing sensor histidine kinase [Spirosoma sp. KNUC1025]|uniref:sensor histidine kinase n=1 Tax=Spirosoma sp. KNUC1025 TaxID=2894082 RepID=UPI0038671820|nr:ATP-binding protein [Spirosoma sp. KNUC1025]
MDEVLSFKELSVSVQVQAPFMVSLPASLADSLVTNLTNNAIKHNQPSGRIELYSTADQLSLSNTGGQLTSDPERLFERFKKESTGPDSVGLGLAIVRQICESYDLTVSYHYVASMHTISLTHSPQA